MTKQVTLKHQHFSEVMPKHVAALRSGAAALTAFLESPNISRTSLGVYWHVVPYLMEGIAKGYDEPYRWFIEGGEVIGRTAAGDVRYLTPDQVALLNEKLQNEEPDELGYDDFDENKLDAKGIYPTRWARDGENADLLGSIRESYSYVREHIAALTKEKAGVVIHLTEDTITDEDDAAPALPADPPPEPPPRPLGDLVLKGSGGRTYHRADATEHPLGTPDVLGRADAAMAKAGLHWVGDFTPGATPGDTIRTYMSDDGTVAAIFYLSKRVGGFQLFSNLSGDAMVSASSAFLLEVKKHKFFAEFLQNKDPETLNTALLARRAKLEKKHGKPVPIDRRLEATVGVWEAYIHRLEPRPR
jgi:Domain of unknown function (DUF1877)